MGYLQHYEPDPSRIYTPIFTREQGVLHHLTLGMISLASGQRLQIKPAPVHEMTLTVLSGSVSAVTKAGTIFENLGGRTSIFQRSTDTLYASSDNEMELIAASACEIVVCQAPSQVSGQLVLFPAAEAEVEQRGKPGWQYEMRTYCSPLARTGRLIVGETINGVGQWSSFPPHKHDTHSLPAESEMEEIDLFKVDPTTGFAFQGLYTPDDETLANQAYLVRNNDAVAIPKGYHPVVAAPGHRVAYFWVLAGVGHDLKTQVDESMRWLEMGMGPR